MFGAELFVPLSFGAEILQYQTKFGTEVVWYSCSSQSETIGWTSVESLCQAGEQYLSLKQSFFIIQCFVLHKNGVEFHR